MTRLPAFFLPVLVLAAMGCQATNTNDSGCDVRTIDGISVVGDDLTPEDVAAIRCVISTCGLDIDQRVLCIQETGANTVEVRTGEMRGPLDGGGDIVLLERVGGAWQVIDDGVHRSWVS